MTKQRKEDIRIGFFRKHRAERGFRSVRIREGSPGKFYLDVGVTEDVTLEDSYEGLPVKIVSSAPAVSAVLPAPTPS